MTLDEQRQRTRRDDLARDARLGVDLWVIASWPPMAPLPRVDQTRLIVQATLGYLIGAGLIQAVPPEDRPEWLAVDIPDHLQPDLARALSPDSARQ